MKKIRAKYFVVGMLLILEIVSLTLMYKSSHNKRVVLDEVKIKELIKSDMISIMTDETGKGTYTEYTTSSSTWPSSSKYKYNSDKSQCINEKGSVVKGVLTFDGAKASLTSNEGMHCTLYFDKIINPLDILRENDDENQITDDLVGGMYRYQGIDGVNNWICFGISAKDTCISEEGIDKYMYRIIGVTSDGQLALIKETGVKVGSTKTFQWNEIFKQTATDCGEDGSKCIWIKSKIYNRLNGLCKSSNVNCKGTTSGTDGNTNIFIGNSNYDYLNTGNSWFNLINDYTWKYGDVTGKFSRVEGQYEISYGDDAYKLESALNTTISAKIGLMYIHDYLYAFPDGKEIRGEMPWININKDVNSQQSLSEWIISRRPMNGDITAWFINEVAPHSTALVNGASVRPVFYLKPNVNISSGSGSKTDPFIITP